MKAVKNVILILLGNFMIALGVSHFVVPAGLISGGATGISLVLNKAFGLPLTACIWVISVWFFLWGLLALGKGFAMSTLLSTVAYPLFFSITSRLAMRTGVLSDDIFLCTAFAGICLGIGIGLVMRAGASTGGSDVVAMVLHRKFGWSLQTMIYVFDAVILCLQTPFAKPEQILYGLLFVLVYTYVIGKVMLFGLDKLQIMIYSARFEEINQAILTKYDKGSTLFHVKGGYSGEETVVVQTVIPRRNLFAIREGILAIDPQAFIVINPVSEVNGRGFTLNKHFGEEE